MGGTTIRRLIGHNGFTASVQRFVIPQPMVRPSNSIRLTQRSRACVSRMSMVSKSQLGSISQRSYSEFPNRRFLANLVLVGCSPKHHVLRGNRVHQSVGKVRDKFPCSVSFPTIFIEKPITEMQFPLPEHRHNIIDTQLTAKVDLAFDHTAG